MGCCDSLNIHTSAGPVIMNKRHDVPLRQLLRLVEIILAIDSVLFTIYIIILIQRTSTQNHTNETVTTVVDSNYPIQFWGIGIGTLGLTWGAIHWVMFSTSIKKVAFLDQNENVPTILSRTEKWMIEGLDPPHYIEHFSFLCYLLVWAYRETPLADPLRLAALLLMIVGGVGMQAYFEDNTNFQHIRQKQRITKVEDQAIRTWESICLLDWDVVALNVIYFMAFSLLYWGAFGPYVNYLIVVTYLMFVCEFIWLIISYLILRVEYYHRRIYYPIIMVVLRMSLYAYSLWHTI